MVTQHISVVPSYHLHIPKTAGTSLNKLISSIYHAEKVPKKNIALYFDHPGRRSIHDMPDQVCRRIIQNLANEYDFIASHLNILDYLPENFVNFCIFRDPIERTFSQYRDFARLNPQDHPLIKPSNANVINNIRSSYSFKAFALKSLDELSFYIDFYNSQTWALVKHSMTFKDFYKLEPEEAATIAFDIVNKKVDLVGFVDNLEEFLKELSTRVVAPISEIPKLNQTTNNTSQDLYSEEDVELAISLNKADQLLYEKLSCFRKPTQSQKSLEQIFIENSLDKALHTIQPYRCGNEYFFDMNMSIIGFGFHDRDSPASYQCCRWNANTKSKLYVPIPEDHDKFTFKIYIKAVMKNDIFTDLKILLNGENIPYNIKNSIANDETFYVLEFEANSHGKSFMEICLIVENLYTDSDIGKESSDTRKKAFCLWKYSYAFRDSN